MINKGNYLKYIPKIAKEFSKKGERKKDNFLICSYKNSYANG